MTIADKIRKIPGFAAAEGALNGAVATERDLPIKDYDRQTVEEIAAKLKGFSQRELRTIDAYERKRENRSTIIDKIAQLTGDEPWSGYDEAGVDAVTRTLTEANADTARRVRTYESDHKNRTTVIQAADARIDRA